MDRYTDDDVCGRTYFPQFYSLCCFSFLLSALAWALVLILFCSVDMLFFYIYITCHCIVIEPCGSDRDGGTWYFSSTFLLHCTACYAFYMLCYLFWIFLRVIVVLHKSTNIFSICGTWNIYLQYNNNNQHLPLWGAVGSVLT